MWRSARAVAIVALSSVLRAQELIPPGSPLERRAAEVFEKAAASPELRCAVQKYSPKLSFSFRYWSGYEATIPVSQLEPREKDRIRVLMRATPKGGSPRYFTQQRVLPALPEDPRTRKRAEISLSGGLILGVGEYALALQISDSTGRVCRAQWKATAPATKVPLRIGAGEVRDVLADRWTGIPGQNTGGLVTVFVHAAPVFPRRNLARLSPWDNAVLLGSLTSLLDTLPFGRARVVAYNLDNRTVLYSDSSFGAEGLQKLAEALQEMNLGIVSAETLQRSTPSDVLRALVESELENEDRAEAVVFLGPLSRYSRKAPPDWKMLRERLPATFGVAVFPRMSQTGDVIQSIVKAAGGDMVMVYQPSDLAKAVREISKAEAN